MAAGVPVLIVTGGRRQVRLRARTNTRYSCEDARRAVPARLARRAGCPCTEVADSGSELVEMATVVEHVGLRERCRAAGASVARRGARGDAPAEHHRVDLDERGAQLMGGRGDKRVGRAEVSWRGACLFLKRAMSRGDFGGPWRCRDSNPSLPRASVPQASARSSPSAQLEVARPQDPQTASSLQDPL